MKSLKFPEVGQFDHNGALCIEEGNWRTYQTFESLKEVFAWIPKRISIFDYVTMCPKKTSRVVWMKTVVRIKNDCTGVRYYIGLDS